jgi:hypothetical protein
MTLRTVLLSLQALLAAAEPDDPQDAVVAKQFKENQDMFRQTARHWTFIYAGGTYISNPVSLSLYDEAFLNLFSEIVLEELDGKQICSAEMHNIWPIGHVLTCFVWSATDHTDHYVMVRNNSPLNLNRHLC